jgi:hypothetical protein
VVVRGGHAAVVVALATIGVACSSRAGQKGDSTSMRRPIEAVQGSHTDSLMRIPGVVGTGIGLCDGTPCIKVLVVRATPELRRAIPDSLEGYRVVLDESGTVRAQDSTRR